MKKLLIDLGNNGYDWIANNWTFVIGVVAGLILVLIVIINL